MTRFKDISQLPELFCYFDPPLSRAPGGPTDLSMEPVWAGRQSSSGEEVDVAGFPQERLMQVLGSGGPCCAPKSRTDFAVTASPWGFGAGPKGGKRSRRYDEYKRKSTARPDRGHLKPNVHNTFGVLSDESLDCSMAVRLRKKARTCVEFFSKELGIKPERDLPSFIPCGQLRSAVRECFPREVGLLAELSIKTSQKLERSCCRSCEPVFAKRLEYWWEARSRPEEIDEAHLASFGSAFRENVPKGWNRSKYPFIPNGRATQFNKRREGGNWNAEPFSETCRTELVFSSGKPRVVTMYSSYNTEVLQSLHQSLYCRLGKKGWLLVGPPTAERISDLTGGGDYLSFDYMSATDNIKMVYVKRAVEILIERADPVLSEEEIRCLRVVASLRLADGNSEAGSGQPMGSLMSFPLLCLFNKTIVDLALTDLLQEGQLSFKEWTGHRCLINGDDLLLREPRKDSLLKDRIYYNAACCGMRTNDEKTMSSPTMAEINSTLFVDGSLQKKSNAAALYMKAGTEDVLGYARESTSTVEGFRQCVRANAKFLACQKRKEYRALPLHLKIVCQKDRKIRKALGSMPAESDEDVAANFFPVCPKPEGYSLTREEEIAAIHSRVAWLRPRVLRFAEEGGLTKFDKKPKTVLRNARSWRSVKYEKKPCREEETILCVLARAWKDKIKDELAEEALGMGPYLGELPPSDLPDRASRMIDAVKAWRKAKALRCDPSTQVLADTPGSSGFETSSDWIAL
jgi:hypothetical protein